LNGAIIEASSPGRIFDKVNITLRPRTWSMNNWVSKFCNFFDGVIVNSKQINGCKTTDSKDAVLLTNINNIVPTNKIFLEEFCDVIDPKYIEILNKCQLIATTSVMNAQFLRTINKNVIYVPKYWPVFNVSERLIQEPYNLIINREKSITKKFIDAYKAAGIQTKLIVIGYRGIPIGFDFYDEYLPHEQLLSLILYSSVVVDFSSIIHYYSGLLDLAFIANKNIITTNHWLDVSKPQVTIVESIIGDNDTLVPNINVAISELNKVKDKNTNFNLESYNYNLLGTLRILGEKW
jgi:hypothetical protein